MSAPDAVVVGSGPNGLAGALSLARAGLSVRVYELDSVPGGGLRTAELTRPGFRHDVCSIGHPLAVASPFFRTVDLARHGVTFAHPEIPFATPLDGGRAALGQRSVEATAEGLGVDGPAYCDLLGPLVEDYLKLIDTVLSPLRALPVAPAAVAALARFAWRAARPQSRLVRRFRTEEAPALLTGAAAHSVLPMTALPTAGYGLVLVMLAHAVGWPVVEGGSQMLADALIAELQEHGGEVITDHHVSTLGELPKAKITLLDTSPRAFATMAGDRLPPVYRSLLRRYRYGPGVCKVDYALSGPVPWTNADLHRVGTVHLGGRWEEMARSEADVHAGRHTERPFVLTVQPGVADPSRAPAGQHTLWAYCHVPVGSATDVSDRITAQVERFAPGFRDVVLDQAVMTAADEERHNPNYVGGDIATGAPTVWQTLFRPVPRWDGHRTPLAGVYLCSSATAPGPGVHGMCGYLAARSALRHELGIRLL